MKLLIELVVFLYEICDLLGLLGWLWLTATREVALIESYLSILLVLVASVRERVRIIFFICNKQ